MGARALPRTMVLELTVKRTCSQKLGGQPIQGEYDERKEKGPSAR